LFGSIAASRRVSFGTGDDFWPCLRISLGSTLCQFRSVYGDVRFVGADKWRLANGVVFVVGGAKEPEPQSSKVVRSSSRPLATSDRLPYAQRL
jgi:hypothetical protein